MPVWNGLTFDERHVQPLSPDFGFNPAGESRLTAYYWINWPDLVSPDGAAAPLAQKALLGFGVTIADHTAGHFTSYSPELVPALNPALTGGMMPYAHPDFPSQFYLAESFQRVAGDLPRGQTARGGANYDEGNVAVSFRCPPNGYRVLSDTAVKNVDATLPGDGWPGEYFCCRNMEIVESMTSKAQSIPPSPAGSGLVWIDAPAAADGNRPAASLAAYVTLWEGEIVIDHYPVPIDGYNESAMQAIVGRTNSKVFPPSAPAGCPASFLSQKAVGTLVFGQPEKRVVRMGDCSYAYRLRYKMKWYPNGANKFYWVSPTIGPPGYYRVARPDGTLLFPSADYNPAFSLAPV